VALDRLLVRAVLAASLVFQVPHFIFHAANTEPFSAANNIVNLGLLAAGLALTVALLIVSSPTRVRTAEPTTTEGGIRYGTH
jgi:ABC-type sulfate transport system permease component